MGRGVRYSISLYCLLIIFIQALRAFSKSIPIREVFSLGLRDLIRLLISTEGLRKNQTLHLHAVKPGNLVVTIGVPLGSY